MKDYDERIAFLGQWGRFQQIVFFLLFVSTIANGTGVLSFVFLAAIPDHRCRIPEVNLTQDWLSVIIPVKVNQQPVWDWVKYPPMCHTIKTTDCWSCGRSSNLR